MKAHEVVREVLCNPPDDWTLDEVIYHSFVVQRVSQGLAEADAGDLIPQGEVEQEFRQRWLLGGA